MLITECDIVNCKNSDCYIHKNSSRRKKSLKRLLLMYL